MSDWSADQARRTYEANLTRLAALSDRTDALEHAFMVAARGFVAAAADLLRHRAERRVAAAVSRYAADYQLPGHGYRPPRRPAHLPQSYVRDSAPYVPIATLLDNWRRRPLG